MREENQAVIKALNMYGRVPKMWELLEEIERLNNTIEKLEQENAVLKTQVVNKDKYSYGIRTGSDKE